MNALLEIAGRESLAQIIENVKGIFTNFQWTDAIDIILLACLFYFVFSFFKSRKTGTLLIGIFLCLLLYTIAVLLNLSGIEYILSGVFKIGATSSPSFSFLSRYGNLRYCVSEKPKRSSVASEKARYET